MLLLTTLFFLAITCAMLGAFMWLVPTKTDIRLRELAGPASKSPWAATIVKVAGPLANLSAPEGDWDASPLRVKFLNAGIRREDARLIYFAAKTVLPLLFAGIAYTLFQDGARDTLVLLMYVLLAATFGCYLPNLIVHLKVRKRRREIFENFPDAADLMLVCVEAGLGLDAALTKVADEIRIKSLPVAEELHLTNLEMRAGGTREKSLRNLAIRTGVEEVGTFGLMLTQADKFGTSIGDSLRVFSDDLRHKRQARAEERAAKIPTKMLFPLVTCIFPSIIRVILGPAIIQIIRAVGPAISGAGG
jgi:tight adherence protein C